MFDFVKTILVIVFGLVWCGVFWLKAVRPLFMSSEKFEEHLKKTTKLTRKVFPKYKPSLILNRLVYLLAFIFGLVVFSFFVFVFINSL